MGGAERAERRRRREAALAAKAHEVRRDASAAGGPERPRRTILGVLGVTLVLALVLGAGIWLYENLGSEELPPTVPLAEAGPTYPVAVEGDAVVIGPDDAPVSIQVYEDYLCSGCAQFTELSGAELQQAAASGQARVGYRPVAILDEASEPPGYSTRAAGASFCAAEAGVFPRFHASLFAAQPDSGGPAWTNDQLVQLGRELGAGDDFARCVHDGDEQRVAAATEQARERITRLRPDGQFGTPTILVDGQVADINAGWLDTALTGTG